MMYSEFIEMSNITECYISPVEYSTLIEPIYMECELSKTDFIALLKEAFNKIVYPAVEKAIHNLPLNDKLLLINSHSEEITETIKLIDFEARNVAYQYIALYSKL